MNQPLIGKRLEGTGPSSTVTARTLAQQGGPVEQAQYLRHFRADSIGKSPGGYSIDYEHVAEHKQ